MLVSYKTIGRNIRRVRVAAHLTQEQMAEKLKMSQLHFGRLERGERPASIEQIAHIALALNTSLDTLLENCTLDPNLLGRASVDSDAQSFADAVAHLGKACSPRARKLMLTLCMAVAEQDRSAEDETT